VSDEANEMPDVEDLDIVHRRSPENVARLRTLLNELDAYPS
jgi:hypothetical protein